MLPFSPESNLAVTDVMIREYNLRFTHQGKKHRLRNLGFRGKKEPTKSEGKIDE